MLLRPMRAVDPAIKSYMRHSAERAFAEIAARSSGGSGGAGMLHSAWTAAYPAIKDLGTETVRLPSRRSPGIT